MTELVGREGNRAGVAEALQRSRVVTLTGPDGVGKTRLAVAVAAGAVLVYRDRCSLVDLSAVERPEAVPDVVVTVLGIQRSQPLPSTERINEGEEVRICPAWVVYTVQACGQPLTVVSPAGLGAEVVLSRGRLVLVPGRWCGSRLGSQVHRRQMRPAGPL